MGSRPPVSAGQPKRGGSLLPDHNSSSLSEQTGAEQQQSTAPPKGTGRQQGVTYPKEAAAEAMRDRLDSWKDIAAYLRRGVRTVIRWEQEEGLPVHRLPHQKRGSVYAHPQELDAWLAERCHLAGQPDAESSGGIPWTRLGGRWKLAVAALALLSLSAFAWWNLRVAEAPAPIAIAVLPFQNEDADPAVAPLCNGIAEGIIRDLSRLPAHRAKVVSYSAVGSLASPWADLAATARRLNVTTLLVGRLAERENRLVVAVELVNAEDQTVLWSARYDRSGAETLSMQREIAAEIARRLPFTGSPVDLRRLNQQETANPEAYRHYVRGRFLWSQRTPVSMLAAIDAFQEAIRADPDFALAWSGLADTYVPLAYYTSVPASESAPKARAAAEQALRLDPDLAEAYAARAYVQADYYWDWESAERDFRRALELNPGSANVHHWYGERLSLVGRVDEALAEYLVALELDPLSLIINTNVAHSYYFGRDYNRTIEHCRHVIGLNEQFPNAHADLGRALLMTQQYPEAIRELERATQLGGGPMNGLGRLGYAYAVAGRREDALRILNRILVPPQGERVAPFAVALVHVGMGNREQAIQWLGRAVDERAVYVTSIGVDPLFDSLREDARFGALLRRINFTR